MAAPSLAALQIAIYSALAGSAAIQALVGNPARVYDHVPQGTVFPYIVIGDDETLREDTTTRAGLITRFDIHVYDRSDENTNRRGRLKTRQILDAIYGVLHDGNLTISGNAHVQALLAESATEILSEDGLTYHGRAVYEIFFQAT